MLQKRGFGATIPWPQHITLETAAIGGEKPQESLKEGRGGSGVWGQCGLSVASRGQAGGAMSGGCRPARLVNGKV